MKKNLLFMMCAMLLMIAGTVMTACGSDDEIDTGQNISALYGRWVLQGNVSNGNFVSYENSGTGECYLILEKDGSFNGRFCNQLQGEYSYSQNGEFFITSCISTMIWSTDSVLMSMEEKIGKMEISSFALEGNSLILYYSPNDCLKFSR